MDDENKIWVAIIAAVASLVVALFSHFSTRSNQRAIEKLINERLDRDALRDYEYEARKRLYRECGPILFQLAEQAEAMYYRIIGLAGTARQGNHDSFSIARTVLENGRSLDKCDRITCFE